VKKQRLQHWILVVDLVWLLAAMIAAYVLRYGLRWHARSGGLVGYVPALLGALATWTLMFVAIKLDGFRRGWDFPAVVSQLFLGVCSVTLVLGVSSYLARSSVDGLILSYFGTLMLTGLIAIRRSAHAILGSKYFVGAVRRIVIVGSGPVAREMATKIERHPEMLCRVVGFLYLSDASIDARLPVIGADAKSVQTLGVTDLLRDAQVDEVVITLSRPGLPEVMNLVDRCHREAIAVSVVPYPYELYLSKPQLIDISGLPILRLHQTNGDFANASWKRGLDVILGTILAILSAPVIVAGAILLLGRKGGPFVRELRCGQFGEPFWMWRMRSDRDCDALPTREVILQQLSITELPQLWNVLLGDMSLVGPRPESPERVKHYSDWQRKRLNVKPGMTGLAQVHGLREQHSSEEKARFDLQYMLHPSLFLDTSLLLQTIWTLAGRMLGLFRRKKIATSREHARRTFTEGRLPSAHSTQSGTD
jgi:putative colanic acid biosysnthesis UDP-glucose lipid carrier transferase